MALRPTRSWTLKGLAVLVLAPFALSACSAGSLGSSDAGDGAGGTTITWLTGTDEAAQASAKAVVDAFQKANPDITVKLDARPAGADGDNLVKTRLQTGTMPDVFDYNSGSLFQQIAPAKNLLPLTGKPLESAVQESFTPQVTSGKDVYGVPYGTAFGGGVMYNRAVFAKLGLQVPKTWAEFMAVSEKIKASGVAPVIQTYQDTWTSQLFILGDFHNITAANPQWAEEYTANKAKYATDPTAVKGFQHLQAVHDAGYENTDFASIKLEDGMRELAAGTGAMYPILSANVSTLQSVAPDKLGDIGFFALPGDDAATNGLTAWYPNAVYVPTTTKGDKLAAAEKLLGFIASPAGCDALTSAAAPTGPYLIDGCDLPADVPQVTKDVQAYFDSGAQSPALEFLSPVKGPNLEQITVEIGSGIRSAADGAALYDEDVKKQAQQLGLSGW